MLSLITVNGAITLVIITDSNNEIELRVTVLLLKTVVSEQTIKIIIIFDNNS